MGLIIKGCRFSGGGSVGGIEVGRLVGSIFWRFLFDIGISSVMLVRRKLFLGMLARFGEVIGSCF